MPQLNLPEEMQVSQRQLYEGLRSKDLKGFVEPIFNIDKFTSKMGEDRDVLVVSFRVNDKLPAMDMMEFVERGYSFVLDADMSTGEERDGKYHVFVELERDRRAPKRIQELLSGISNLTDNWDWRFRYHRDGQSYDFTEQAVMEHVPLDNTAYETRVLEDKNKIIRKFFDQSAFDNVVLDENDTITITKPYSGSVTMKLMALGKYDEVKDSLAGGLQLDEASQSQVTFLEKYLGNYEIHKIADKFLIRNDKQAMIVFKDRW